MKAFIKNINWRLLIIMVYVASFIVLLIPSPVMATSNYTGATWVGILTVGNNGTATTIVSSNSNVTSALLTGSGYIAADASDTAVVNSIGTDVAYMPSSTDSWIFWEPTIGADTYDTYLLYSGGTTSGGKQRWFPGASGGTTVDSPSLELGNNFTIIQNGYVDASKNGEYLLQKTNSIDIYLPAANNITASLNGGALTVSDTITSGEREVRVRAHNNAFQIDVDKVNLLCNGSFEAGDPPVGWLLVGGAFSTFTRSNTWPVTDTYHGILNRNGTDASIIQYIDNYTEYIGETITVGAWIKSSFAGCAGILVADGVSSPTSIHPGDGTYHWLTASLTVNAAASYLRIVIFNSGVDDNVFIDGASLVTGSTITQTTSGEVKCVDATGVSVANTANNYTTFTNYVVPYAGENSFQKIYINGVLQQEVEWSYGVATFTDLSGNGHDMIPTFRTDSSDTDVFTTLTLFSPIEEAKAPSYALTTGTSSFITGGTMSGCFSTTVSPTFPGADIFVDIATAGSVPVQLPLMIVSCVGILIISLLSSWITRRFGNGNVFVKVILIGCLMGILVGVKVYDFWMIMAFGILAVALAMASQQRGLA